MHLFHWMVLKWTWEGLPVTSVKRDSRMCALDRMGGAPGVWESRDLGSGVR